MSLDGLSVRAKNCLFSEGIKTKEQLIDLIIDGDVGALWLKKIPDLGKKTFKEILIFAGFSDESSLYETRFKIKLMKDIKYSIDLLTANGYTVTKAN